MSLRLRSREDSEPGDPGAPVARARVAALLGITGEILVTLSVVLALFVVYQLWWTGRATSQAQDDLRHEIQQEWSQDEPSTDPTGDPDAPPERPDVGDGVAVISSPALGDDWSWVVVEGVRLRDLRKGPGHYSDSAMPGEIGNFAVAGHRTTYGAPFGDIGELEQGDEIVVETRDGWFTYRVDRRRIVQPTEVEVVAPVPEQPGVTPTEAHITLTTCHPKYSSSRRLIVFGTLVDSRTREQGPPAVIAG